MNLRGGAGQSCARRRIGMAEHVADSQFPVDPTRAAGPSAPAASMLPPPPEDAASDPSQTNTQTLPATWTAPRAASSDDKTLATPTLVALTRSISVPNRGDARIELMGPVDYPIGAFWEAQAGVWAIGAASMVLL